MNHTRMLAPVAVAAMSVFAWAQAPQVPAPAFSAQTRAQARAAISKGLGFLAGTQQANGSWQHFEQDDPAITALAAKCFIQQPDSARPHIVDKALARVLSFRQPDGGIYPPGLGLRNYYTSVSLMALAATADERYAQAVREAREYLEKLQWDEHESIDVSNTWYGGSGYGKHKRPDLSNTQVMLEALRQSGLSPDDPTYKKALKFIERCQMRSESNDQPFARGADDGGFVYTPVGGGESKAGTIAIDDRPPRLRSYGSMTYAGFKSYLYAGLERNDPRVQAALEWIRNHYTLEHNPNMPGARSLEGLYYYYHVFARAMHAWNEPVLVDAHGKSHNWREDLCAKLVSLQNPDGSWVNAADRWYEGNPQLVTAYAILALQTALSE